jgi:hypothetical protein
MSTTSAKVALGIYIVIFIVVWVFFIGLARRDQQELKSRLTTPPWSAHSLQASEPEVVTTRRQ